MTARSGDALSHADSLTRRDAVDAGSTRPNFGSGADRPSAPVSEAKICSAHIGMAAMSGALGTIAAGPLHLPITCLNLSIPKDDCIRK